MKQTAAGRTVAGARRPGPGWRCGVAALLMGALWSAALAASDAATYLREAQAAFEKSVYPAAVTQLNNALLIEPDNGEARLLLGRSYLELKAGKSAARELARARELGMPRERVLAPLGRALLMSGQGERLLQEISPETGDPADLKLEILLLQGQACLATGRLALADERFSTALELQPASAGALLGKAHLSHRNGATAEAAGFIDQALAVAPGNTEAWAIKGALLRADGENQEAVAAFDRALAIDPANLPALLGRATARIALREPDKALWDIAAIQQLYPQYYQADYLTALARYQQQQPGPAREAVDRALERQPGFLPAQLLAGTLAYQQGEYNRAEQHLRTYWSRDPANQDATKLLGAVLLKLSKPGQAVAVLGPGAAAAAGDAQYLALLGSALMAHGETARGVEYLQQAAELAPDVASISTQLAIGQRVQGALEGTASDVGSAVELDQDLLQADLLLVMTYLKRQEFEKALGAAEDMAAKLPDSPLPQHLIGAAQLGKGDPAAARQAFEAAIRRQPDFPPAQAALGQLEIAANNLEAAGAIAHDMRQASPGAAPGEELTGDVLMAREDPVAAITHYEKAYDKAPSARLARKRFHTWQRAGDDARAEAALRAWLFTTPGDLGTRALLIGSLQQRGEQDLAIEQYLTLLEYQPEHVATLNNLALLYQQSGNPAGLEYAERAHRLAPERPEVTDTLGWLLVQNGETNRGLVLLQEARVQAPHLPEIHYHMAVALHRAGRSDEAREELDRLLRTGKPFSGIDQARALRAQLDG